MAEEEMTVPIEEVLDEDLEETEGEDTEEWTPPTKEEFEKIQKELKRAQDQAVKNRQKLKEVQQTPVQADDIEKVKAEAAQEVENKYKSRIVFAEARAELTKMGIVGDATKLLKLIDLDEIDVEDDDVLGLSTQLEQLKEDFPTLFETKKTVKADPRTKRDATPKDEVKPPASSLDAIARYMQRH